MFLCCLQAAQLSKRCDTSQLCTWLMISMLFFVLKIFCADPLQQEIPCSWLGTHEQVSDVPHVLDDIVHGHSQAEDTTS